MRRILPVLLFAAAMLFCVCTWQEFADRVNLHGNAAVRYYQQPLVWHLRWAFLGFVFTGAFVFAAPGRWRLAAAVPLAICAFLTYAMVVLIHASA